MNERTLGYPVDAWTSGNDVTVHVDGASYFARLDHELRRRAGRGVEVRGLLWRSHPRQANFDEQNNMQFAPDANQRGAVLALDGRVRRGGSHHQKFVLIGHGPTLVS